MAFSSPLPVTVSDPVSLSLHPAFQGTNFQPHKKGQKWKPEEDELLQKAIQTFGQKKWREIAKEVPGRTSVQCLHRWTKILKPGQIKGAWREEEDILLRAWVEANGPQAWAKCAQVIKGRNGKQCRERWNNALDPSLNHGKWTSEEDMQIFNLYNQYGPKWSYITSLMRSR